MEKTKVLVSSDTNSALADLAAIRAETGESTDEWVVALATFPVEIDPQLKNRAIAWFHPAFDLSKTDLYIAPSLSSTAGRWGRALIRSATKISRRGYIQVVNDHLELFRQGKGHSSGQCQADFWRRVGVGRRQLTAESVVEFLMAEYTVKQPFEFARLVEFQNNTKSGRKLGLTISQFETCRRISDLARRIAYRASALSSILRSMLPEHTLFRLMEVGGRIELLLGEMVMEFGPRVESAVLVESNLQSIQRAARLNRWLRQNGHRRLQIQQALHEESEWDLLSCNVLLLIDTMRQQNSKLQQVLNAAWKALEPEGLLVVYQRVKSPSLSRDHDVVFTADDLKAHLGQFAPISYFSSDGKPLKEDQVGVKTVFRTLRKVS